MNWMLPRHAPHDGTVVLAWCGPRTGYALVYYSKYARRWLRDIADPVKPRYCANIPPLPKYPLLRHALRKD